MLSVQNNIKSSLSDEQLEELREKLTTGRDELTVSIESLSKVVASRTDCDVLNSGDSASFNEAHDRAVTLSNRQKESIAEIDAALDRISKGRYGFSEVTGMPISFDRLSALPWARTGPDC
jgi:DnaK suppressor protein